MRKRTILATLAALAAYAAPTLTPDAFAITWPGERPLTPTEQVALDTFQPASTAYWTRVAPDRMTGDTQRCPAGVAYTIADDLRGDDTPADKEVLGRGWDCKVVLLAEVIGAMESTDPGYAGVAARHQASYVLTHEDGHAIGFEHSLDPADVMFGGDAVTIAANPSCPECDAAFPAYAEAPLTDSERAMIAAREVEAAALATTEARVCIPAWAGRSSAPVLTAYLDGRTAQARLTFRRWATHHPRRAKQLRRSRILRCVTVTQG